VSGSELTVDDTWGIFESAGVRYLGGVIAGLRVVTKKTKATEVDPTVTLFPCYEWRETEVLDEQQNPHQAIACVGYASLPMGPPVHVTHCAFALFSEMHEMDQAMIRSLVTNAEANKSRARSARAARAAELKTA
jgi:hypothetical protein